MNLFKHNRYIFASLIFILGFSPIISFANSGYYVTKNFKVAPNDKNGNKKVILITIDDGPSKYGRDMADTLVKHRAGAIFFINGIHDKRNQGNISYQSKLGFAIGNHTWGHSNLAREKNKDKVKKEIENNSKLITKLTGTAPRFFRSPFGSGDTFVRSLVQKDSMIYMNWSGAAKDWESNTKNKDIFLKNVMKDLHPGEILLIHEHAHTAKYLDDLLTILEKEGYSFVDPKDITN